MAPPLTLTAIHCLIVGTVGWLLLGGGLTVLSERLLLGFTPGALDRRIALVVLSAIYLHRFTITVFGLLPRKMPWIEVGTVGPWLGIVHLSFALAGGTNPAPMGIVAILGLVLYVLGSYLNTASEWNRQRWKKRSENKGKLYTEGFYKICMHPNYLGDVLLFTGFAMVTGRIWVFLVPFLMTLTFAFVHIPNLDTYLAERYGEQFDAYAKRTRRLFPGVW
jgi:protein-S-isoprenylcysteine O-methyltransferase Ste14